MKKRVMSERDNEDTGTWQAAGTLIGMTGALLSLLYVALIWRVLRSPGDDNPMAFVFVLGAAASWIPGSGLLLLLGKRHRSPLWWLWLLERPTTRAAALDGALDGGGPAHPHEVPTAAAQGRGRIGRHVVLRAAAVARDQVDERRWLAPRGRPGCWRLRAVVWSASPLACRATVSAAVPTS